MFVEKLTIKDTFKIWRDKINYLIDKIAAIPAIEDNGSYTISEELTGAKSVTIDVPTTALSPDNRFAGSLDGNAKTASSLENKVKINGTDFDGSEDIKTNAWGMYRNIRITDAFGDNISDFTSVDGSNDFVIKLPRKIKADIDGSIVSNQILSKPVSINGILFDGSNDVINYGVCSTASDVRIKEVSLISQDYTLFQGSLVTVKFLYENTADGELLLNVNGSGGIPLMNRGVPIESSSIKENSVFTFVYDGNAYNLVGSSSSGGEIFQSHSSEDVNYPLIASPFSESETVSEIVYDNDITINPSTGTLTCNNIVSNDNIISKSLISDTINSTSFESTSIIGEDLVISNNISTFTCETNNLSSKYITATDTIESKGTLSTKTLTVSESITTNSITSNNTINTKSLVVSDTLEAKKITSTENVETKSLIASDSIEANVITSNSTITGSSLIVEGITANTITSTETIDTNTFTANELTANSIKSNNTITGISLSVNDIISNTLNSKNITVDNTITANNITSNESITAPSIIVDDYISVNDITSSGNIITNTLETSSLTSENISVSESIHSNNVIIDNALECLNITSDSITSSGNITSNTLETSSLTSGNISVSGSIHSNSIDIDNNLNVGSNIVAEEITINKITSSRISNSTGNAKLLIECEIDSIDYEVLANEFHGFKDYVYAEFFEKGEEEVEDGDIIAFDISSEEEAYVKATKDSNLVVGVCTNSYGCLIGGRIEDMGNDYDPHDYFIPVGTRGRVKVKFIGPSELGKPVVPSETPGVGCLYDSTINTESQIVGYVVSDPSTTEELRMVKILLK